MRELLLRIGTPDAQAVLRQEPFSRLAPRAAADDRPSAPGVAPDCESEPTLDAQVACADRDLASVRGDHQRRFDACRNAVAAPLRADFAAGEKAWERALPARCDADAVGYDDPGRRDLARSRCLAHATRERAHGMLAAHPECRPGS